MKKVNLTKYGFVRWPEEDFNDDGNRFTCYRAGKSVRVSKLVVDGEIYLSIESDCGNGTLPYETYSKLPYYKEATWTYNGVSIETLTEEDLQAFYEACINYEQAYLNEEANIEYPTLDEIKQQCDNIIQKTKNELAEIERMLKNINLIDIMTKISKYDWAEIQQSVQVLTKRINNFDNRFMERVYKTSYSFSFIKRDNRDLTEPSYEYSFVLKILKPYIV